MEDEHCYFAEGVLVHNCDCLSQMLAILRDDKWLFVPEYEPVEEDVEYDYAAKRAARANPYAA